MGVSVGSVTESNVAPRELPTAFDDIVGSPVAPSATAAPAQRVAAPVAHAPRSTRKTRTTRGHGQALVAFGVLVVAGIALGASVIVSVEVAQTPFATSGQSLTGEKLAASAQKDAAVAGPAFGSSAAVGTDLAVTVTDPIAYTPTPKAVGAGDGVDVVSTVTVTNLGSGPLTPILGFTVTGTTGTRIFDAPGGIRLGGTRSLEPGESASYRVAFAVGDVQKMALEVSNGSGDQVVFGG